MHRRTSTPLPATGVSRAARVRPTPTALAIHLCVIAGAVVLAGGPTPVAAQAPAVQAADSGQALHYDIPAGPLSVVLTRFSGEAGIYLIGASGQAEDKTSPGLKGTYTVHDGLAALLAGTGLQAYRQADGSYGLRSAPIATLSSVTVIGRANDGATEGTGSYTNSVMNTATRLTLSMRETPQSVTVLSRQRMDDEGLITLSDAVRSTPGLSVVKDGPERDEFYARGFAVGNITYDGVPTSLDATYGKDTLLSDLAIYDRIEIVRGATGLTQGSGNPGAAINLVRKRPTRDAQFSATINAGNWDRYGGQLDASGALNEAGTLRARGVLSYQDHGSFQDLVNSQRRIVYGIVEADLGERTLLTVGAWQQKNDNLTSWRGLPVAPDGGDLGLPRSTFLGNAWNRWNKQTRSLFTELEHRFDSGWRAKLSATRIKAELDYLATTVGYDAVNGRYNQNVGQYPYVDRKAGYDAYASGPFSLLGRQHELVLGASRRNSDLELIGSGAVLYSGMDLYAWDHGLVPRPSFSGTTFSLVSHEQQEGVYATARLNLAERLKLIAGARADWFEAGSDSPWGTSDYRISRQLTRYAGIIYDVDERHSVYASYTDIFQPQDSYGTDMQLLAPVAGRNHEVGIKGEYFDGALNASLAVFRIDQENLAVEVEDQSACPGYPDMYCYRAAGLVRSQGVDLEIQGAITPDWQLAAGYTFVDKKYRADGNPANVGQRASTGLPRQQFKLSTLYRVPGAWAGGRWRVGGNVSWQSGIHHASTGFRSSQRAYAIVGLVAGYAPSRHLDLQLNVNNLFDKVYYQAISSAARLGDNIYGAPRNFMLTARYTF